MSIGSVEHLCLSPPYYLWIRNPNNVLHQVANRQIVAADPIRK